MIHFVYFLKDLDALLKINLCMMPLYSYINDQNKAYAIDIDYKV